MDFGLVLGILIVVAVCVYLWLGRENNKLDGLDETFPSDCSVDTKPDVSPAAPPKAEPVFAKAVLAPDAAEDAAVAKAEAAAPPPPQKPKAKAKAKAPAVTQEELESMTKKQIDKLASEKGIKLDARKNKATMIKTFLDSL